MEYSTTAALQATKWPVGETCPAPQKRAATTAAAAWLTLSAAANRRTFSTPFSRAVLLHDAEQVADIAAKMLEARAARRPLTETENGCAQELAHLYGFQWVELATDERFAIGVTINVPHAFGLKGQFLKVA